MPPRQSGRTKKKKLSAVTMASFTFSLLHFTRPSGDDRAFVSADKQADWIHLLATKSPQSHINSRV